MSRKKNFLIQITLKFKGLDRFSPNLYETLISINAFEHKISVRKLEICTSQTIQRKLKKNSKMQLKRFNRFLTNLIPKVLDRYILFVCGFRTIAQISRRLELTHTFFNNFKILLRPASVRALFRPCAIRKFRGCTSKNSGVCVNTCSCLNHAEKVYSSRVSASKDQYCTEDHS